MFAPFFRIKMSHGILLLKVVWLFNVINASKPNILIFFAGIFVVCLLFVVVCTCLCYNIFLDDMQYTKFWEESIPGDGSNGINYSNFPTPTIDRIRDEGIIFTRSYASSPVCAPARYSLLTGRYASKCQNARITALRDEFNAAMGTSISVPTVKMSGIDLRDNLPNTLRGTCFIDNII